MSYGQGQLWFLDQINPGSVAYHVVKSVRLTGPLNELALVAAFDGLVRRHEALRTTFLSIDGEPRCRIGPEPTTKLASIDLEDLPRTEREAAIVHQVTDETVLPFDLQQGPLLRAKLFRIDALDHVLLLAMHPIVCDGGSIGVMLRDLAALYQERTSGPTARLPELARQYRDFAAWQRSAESDSSFETALVYWKRQLAGAPSSVALPIAKPAGTNRAGRTHQKEFRLSPGRLAAIRAVGQRHGCSLFVTLLAAFQSLLHRCSGQSEIVVGSPFAGRSRFEAENQVGFYVNFLPLKADFASDPTFSEILVQVRDTLLAAMETEDVPLLKIVEATQPVRQPGRSPLFNVLVVLEEASDSSWQVPGVDCRVETPVDAEAMVDLSLALKETAGELHGALKYDALIFDAPDISRLLVHFQTLLDAVAADPQMRVAELPLMPETERRRVLVEWNDTSLAYPRDRCLHQLIEAQADRTPNAIALVAGEKRFTYRELNSAANRLAHHLTRLGAGPERRVGIFMDRSRAMVIGLLAILKTGAAYVPLDPAYPRDRIAFIVEDADCGILLTEDRHLSALPNHRAQVVCLDSLDVSEESEGDWVCTGSPGDLAYVIFTSGSTGRPKGVAIEHRSVVALVEWARTVFGPEELAGVLFATSICFDLSVFELFVPLSLGGTVLLADNILQLPTLPARSEVKLVNTVPSALAELLRSSPLPPSVQTVNLAGEPLPAALVERIYAESNVQKVYDLYGPTEDTVYSTFTLRTRGGPTTIGRPIANTQAYILDRHLQPQPIGVPGELFLGGEGLARGYLNRTDLTAEKFVSNPFDLSPGARLYRTGDLARYLDDGNIEFLGRLDHQVKIRGFRIELGEIEAVLETSPGVRQALVTAQEEDGENCLVAYVEGESPEAVAPVTLRAFIRSRLPEHMIPSFIVGVPAMPLTPNGKVDRRALAALPKDRVRTAGGQTPPSTPTEIGLAEIWGEILGLKTVAANENFFELGGHSLKAVRVVSRVRAAFAIDLPVRALLEHPTIARLGAFVDAPERGAAHAPEMPVQNTGTELGQFPASTAQQQLWLLDQLDPGNVAYNLPTAIHLDGSLDKPSLRAALDALVRRHEPLRTTFTLHGSGLMQTVHPAGSCSFEELAFVKGTEPEASKSLDQVLTDRAIAPFDLAHGPLFRAHLIQTGGQFHILLLVAHHAVCDGWSLGVIARDLAKSYNSFRANRPASFPEKGFRFADFAGWQRDGQRSAPAAGHLAYWRDQLAEAPAELELPADRPRNSERRRPGAWEPVRISPSLAAGLKGLALSRGCNLFSVLLSAFHVLLHRLSGQPVVVVGTPLAGRTRVETEDLVGMFVNVLPLKADCADNPTFEALLAEVHHTAWEAQDHQDLPFGQLVETLLPGRTAGTNPFFQSVFVLQNTPQSTGQMDGISWRWDPVCTGTAKFDLTLVLTETGDGLEGFLEYDSGLFLPATAARWAKHLMALLQSVVAQPQQRISFLPLLSEAERHQLVVEWNDTADDYPRDRRVHELFEQQARSTPDRVAVQIGEQSLTYFELNQQAERWTKSLVDLGVGPDVLVGISVERSMEMVVGLLAILKAGGAYLPLDPDYPRERLVFMLRDASPRVLLTQTRLHSEAARWIAAAAEDGSFKPPATLDLDDEPPDAKPSTRLRGGSPDDLAYVIYTSGSTGQPKGVEIPHRGVVRLVKGTRYASFGPDEVFLQMAPLAFDASTFEIWGPLLNGGRLVLMPPGRPGLEDIGREIKARGITTLWLTSGLFHLMVEERLDDLKPLRQLLAGGDALSPSHVVRARKALVGCRLINGYGPTESTTFACCHDIHESDDAERSVPIGRPIANTRVHLLDAHLQPVPVGMPGELFIGGDGLARGYLHRPELTREKFVADPFSSRPGSRLYRTGDRARYRPDGSIEFLGRVDDQVKIRGFRVELGELEAVLASHPHVGQVAAIVRTDPRGKTLAACFVARSEPAPTKGELRQFLAGKLPDHMQPSAFLAVAAFPLTPNGKIDRRALGALDGWNARPEAAVTAPRSQMESRLAAIWEELLGLSGIGIEEDFFSLGGHSLLAVRMVHRINRDLIAGLGTVDLFNHPTIEKLAHCLASRGPGTAPTARIVPLRRGSGTRPVFFLYAGPDEWNLASLFHEAGPVFGIQVPWRKEWHAAAAEGRTSALPTLEELVAPYTAEIRKSPDASGCILAGFSFAGLMAHEAARQLRRSGHRVDDLFLFDAWAYDPSIFQIWNHRVAQLWRQHPVEGPWKEVFSTFRSNLRATWKLTWEVVVRQKRRLWAWFQKLPPEPHMHAVTSLIDDEGEGITVGCMLAIYQKIFANLRAKPLPGSVALFRAIHAKENELHGMDESLGWNRLHPDGVEIVPVEGEHHSMFQREPHRAALAKAIGEVMARRNRGSS